MTHARKSRDLYHEVLASMQSDVERKRNRSQVARRSLSKEATEYRTVPYRKALSNHTENYRRKVLTVTENHTKENSSPLTEINQNLSSFQRQLVAKHRKTNNCLRLQNGTQSTQKTVEIVNNGQLSYAQLFAAHEMRNCFEVLKHFAHSVKQCPFCRTNAGASPNVYRIEDALPCLDCASIFSTLKSAGLSVDRLLHGVQALERQKCCGCRQRKVRLLTCCNCASFLVKFSRHRLSPAVKDLCCCGKRGVLRRSSDHRQHYEPCPPKEICSAPEKLPAPPLRVLSLFDGIATGVVALKQLGIQIEKFVASEINENAINVVANWHPEAKHVGDVTSLAESDACALGPFDLLIAGSPCNDLSGANPRRKGLLDPKGTGCLFFDFYRILQAVKPSCYRNLSKCVQGGCHMCKRPFFWLFENVASMKKIEKERISRFLCCEPVKINAIEVSAAARPRFFWGNIPGLQSCQLRADSERYLTVQDCLEPGRVATVEKLNTITSKKSSIHKGTSGCAPVMHNNKEDSLWSTEIERIFGVPDHYTDVNNLTPKERQVLLGRSWSVPVIRQIFEPLKSYFKVNLPS